MLNRFIDYISAKKLILPNSTTLLAVSGGKDSMVMADLMLKGGYPIHIGHINHHLRGKESEADAKFVQTFCEKHQVPYHQYDIDPYLLTHGNLQDRARQIRYDKLTIWANEYKCEQIATAHHLDDRIETFLMYIMRGTGLNGLSSILPKNEKIIRPLLWATTDEITSYIDKDGIAYREDSSNNSDKYLRNQVRHHIIPAMTQADNRATAGLKQTIENMESTSILFDFLLDTFAETLITYCDGYKTIAFNKITPYNFAAELLFHLIRKDGFNIYQCRDILRNMNGHFYSLTHEAIVHQDTLIIRRLIENNPLEPITIKEIPMNLVCKDQYLSFEKVNEFPKDFKSENQFFLNADHIKWPMTIRNRQEGDTFSPYGMQGKTQKVKDYLIHRKLSAFEKEKVLILEDQCQILAILPFTIAHDVRVTPQSEEIIVIKFQ